MHCGTCIRRVSQALNAVEGVKVQEVRIGAARLSSQESLPPIQSALSALENAGYTAQLES
jgi:copper chaperone